MTSHPGRQLAAGLFIGAFVLAAQAGELAANSSDGRFAVRASEGAATLEVRDAASGRLLREIPVIDRNKAPALLAWIIDLPARSSFLAGLAGRPEAWELPYGSGAEPVFEGLVHDYRMGEAIASTGPLPVRRIPLQAPLPRPAMDARQIHALWVDPREPTRLRVLNLDVRREIAVIETGLALDSRRHASRDGEGRRRVAIGIAGAIDYALIDATRWRFLGRSPEPHSP